MTTETKNNKKNISIEGYSGILEIEKIDLILPIKHEAVHENMTTSVATIKHRKLKEGLNYSIAGHRNIRYGKNFNRLDELEEGDEIRITNEEGIHVFIIRDKDIVLPDDGSVLDDNDKTEVTLVTCHPPMVSSHRLILKGEKVDEKKIK